MRPMKGRMQSKNNEVLEQLRAAFPATEIHSEGAFASWGMTYLDGEAYQRQLSGKRWPEFDRAYLALRSDALGFLGTAHLVAVLPAYLTEMVEADPFSTVPDMLAIVLTMPGSSTDSGLGKKRFNELVAALSAPQRAAVAAVLQRFAEEHAETGTGNAVRLALDVYWHQFLEEES